MRSIAARIALVALAGTAAACATRDAQMEEPAERVPDDQVPLRALRGVSIARVDGELPNNRPNPLSLYSRTVFLVPGAHSVRLRWGQGSRYAFGTIEFVAAPGRQYIARAERTGGNRIRFWIEDQTVNQPVSREREGGGLREASEGESGEEPK